MVRGVGKVGYRIPKANVFSPIKQGPFPVLEKVRKLVYRLGLPAHLSRIHPVVSVVHLEPKTLGADEYNREPVRQPIRFEGDDYY